MVKYIKEKLDIDDDAFYIQDGVLIAFTDYEATHLDIPYGVIGIGDDAFYSTEHEYKLESVNLPNSVKWIGQRAFFGLESLTSVTIPESVTVIERWAFHSTGLKEITIPHSVTFLGDHVFAACKSLEHAQIFSQSNCINNGMFDRCLSLRDVTIGPGVSFIEHQAFGSCSSLISIVIPKNVKAIGELAFAHCHCLCNVEVQGKGVKFTPRSFINCDDDIRITYLGHSFSTDELYGLTPIQVQDLVDNMEGRRSDR